MKNNTDAKKKSRDYFNAHRKSKLARWGYWKHDYKFAFSVIRRIQPKSLIDIGCGPGGFLEDAHFLFPNVSLGALDLSEEMIKETQLRLPKNVTTFVGDSENIPIGDKKFQVVTCNMSLHHYPHPQNAVNEMHRILQDGGYLLLNDLDCIAPIRTVTNIVFPLLNTGDVKMYSKEEILSLVNGAGFRRVVYRKISPFTFQCIAKK